MSDNPNLTPGMLHERINELGTALCSFVLSAFAWHGMPQTPEQLADAILNVPNTPEVAEKGAEVWKLILASYKPLPEPVPPTPEEELLYRVLR